MKSSSATNQIKATEQYFPVVLLIMLYKVVQTFQFEDKILKCDLSNLSYCVVHPCSPFFNSLYKSKFEKIGQTCT